MKRRGFVRDNGLSLFFGLVFLLALFGQSLTGRADTNNHRRTQGRTDISYVHYVTSSDFAVDVAENWQSEYLQFLLYIVATIWLVQRGSPESKEPGEEGTESDAEQKIGEHAKADSPRWAAIGGLRTTLYSSSLALWMGALFLGSWAAQSIAGWSAYNEQQLGDKLPTVSWGGYATSADFWNRTLQNWQSEFLAVGSMVVFSVYLRQRGSPESKPVGASHAATADSG
ncbi:MAG: hypothetical protein QOE63_600 [Acidimicrobiaceae bacterium]|jgi:hypothetical protein